MSNQHVARRIVAVPAFLLGGVFLATAAWLPGDAASNRPLALFVGSLLLLTALWLVLGAKNRQD